jgi:hypothetical protein
MAWNPKIMITAAKNINGGSRNSHPLGTVVGSEAIKDRIMVGTAMNKAMQISKANHPDMGL